MLTAVTRPVSPTLADCQLTHLPREPIDVARAAREHAGYEDALRALGARVVRAPAAPELPDAVFVEDTAVVLDEVAVVTRPGAPARRAETEAVERVLSAYRPVLRIEEPGTMDGGDVVRIGRTLHVGLSGRTNRAALGQLQALLGPWGYRVVPVEVAGCLHLKSAVTAVGERTILVNPDWVSPGPFGARELVTVDRGEPRAANALLVGGTVLCASHFPRTAERLERAGVRTASVECAELAKAEGGLTCCSIVFEGGGP